MKKSRKELIETILFNIEVIQSQISHDSWQVDLAIEDIKRDLMFLCAHSDSSRCKKISSIAMAFDLISSEVDRIANQSDFLSVLDIITDSIIVEAQEIEK